MKFSKLMLGTVQFGLNYGIANEGGKPSYETAREIIQTAYEGGVTSLDTAAGYGDSEDILGRALSELQLRDKVQVISKVPPVPQDNPSVAAVEKHITENVENSLKRLRLERLSVCLFHREDDIRYIEVMRKMEQKGLIGAAGVSLDTNRYCDDVLAAKIKHIQLPYNLMDKRFDAFFLAAQQHGIAIFSRSVYLQGLLLMPEEKIKPSLQEIIPLRRRVEQLAMAAGMEMSELCMRFVLSNPAITSVLTGVDNCAQLRQNLELFAKGVMPLELYRQAQAAVPELEEKIIRPGLWNK